MNKLESRFNTEFAHWNIRLPRKDTAQRRRGRILKAGWVVWYLFGSDEKGEYLDYYASHRMADDRHVRFYASGQEEELPTIRTFRSCSQDHREDKELAAEYQAENRRIARLLEEKGFGLTGDEPGGVLINRALRVRMLE